MISSSKEESRVGLVQNIIRNRGIENWRMAMLLESRNYHHCNMQICSTFLLVVAV